jgi:hypothetical protein
MRILKADQVRAAIAEFSGPFRATELQALCPGVSIGYVRKLLTALKEEGVVRVQGRGPSTRWVAA